QTPEIRESMSNPRRLSAASGEAPSGILVIDIGGILCVSLNSEESFVVAVVAVDLSVLLALPGTKYNLPGEKFPTNFHTFNNQAQVGNFVSNPLFSAPWKVLQIYDTNDAFDRRELRFRRLLVVMQVRPSCTRLRFG